MIGFVVQGHMLQIWCWKCCNNMNIVTLSEPPIPIAPPQPDGGRRHLPVDPAQRKLHQRRRADRGEGGGVPHAFWKPDRQPTGRQTQPQDRPPGPRHRVRDQRAAHQTPTRAAPGPGASAQGPHQVCRWKNSPFTTLQLIHLTTRDGEAALKAVKLVKFL